MRLYQATAAYFCAVILHFLLSACSGNSTSPRTTQDFNFSWKFHLGELDDVNASAIKWEDVRLPHDWSIVQGYQAEGTAASTGFVPGGIGYYKKEFSLPASDQGKVTWIEFDGIFCNSEVWINGHLLGFRPNGYTSFSYDLTEHLKYGDETNTLVVKADHSAYADTRWYTGSGIYREVRLVTTSPTHIPQWGVRVTTPEVSAKTAMVVVNVAVDGATSDSEVSLELFNPSGEVVASQYHTSVADGTVTFSIPLPLPELWDTENPNLYSARTTVSNAGAMVDEVNTTFGIRSIEFTADRGFLLNGERVKLKGVNLHHDVGALGAAAAKATWEYRVRQLKSIGVNAIRMAHNPHSSDLMEVCDEMGMLVMDEFFDEWHRPKGKSVVYLGDNAARSPEADGYSNYFLEWGERDLKDLIRRDYNHPSVIMWSIGNEIEWTFPEYSQAYFKVNPGIAGYGETPNFDPEAVRPAVKEVIGTEDSLAIIAKLLAKWVKEEDTTRPTVCGSVRPSISLVTGYGKAVDVLGFNYRQQSYDAAHAAYPDLKILGSENWGDYTEWKMVNDRDFVAGMFAWTGFAYLGEAGPWPRKGLEISFFDYAGFKTPRGHFFESLWREEPKAYLVSTPAATSEFAYNEAEGWSFTMQKTPPPVWSELRRWEWYKVDEYWNYEEGENIIVQAYTNCPEAELFLNGQSLGKLARADFAKDNILKWLVPYTAGELMLKGYQNGQEVTEFKRHTVGPLAKIVLVSDKYELQADQYDQVHVTAELYDADGHRILNLDEDITFSVSGAGELQAVDNGWEQNVSSHQLNRVRTHNGRALAIIRAGGAPGETRVTAKIGAVESEPLVIQQE
ncbi:MAG: sugar-binding domain-containing protein [Bacteroidota bacterium]